MSQDRSDAPQRDPGFHYRLSFVGLLVGIVTFAALMFFRGLTGVPWLFTLVIASVALTSGLVFLVFPTGTSARDWLAYLFGEHKTETQASDGEQTLTQAWTQSYSRSPVRTFVLGVGVAVLAFVFIMFVLNAAHAVLLADASRPLLPISIGLVVGSGLVLAVMRVDRLRLRAAEDRQG